MPRRARISSAGLTYHVLNRAGQLQHFAGRVLVSVTGVGDEKIHRFSSSSELFRLS
jgi:hypothetical protein